MSKFTRDDVDKFHDYSLYIPERTIFVGSEEFSTDGAESGTDGAMAERLIKNLVILEALNKNDITIIMNNIGGDEYHGLAIYDAIQACDSHVTIRVHGHAMSMGSIILQAADLRVMAPNSKQMIHYGDWSFEGHAKTGQKIAKEYEKLNVWMEEMYLKRIHEKMPNYPIRKLKRLLDHDTYLTAEESVLMGLADKVLGREE